LEYEENLKYKFFDLIDKGRNKPNLCVLVIKVKKLQDNKCAFDQYQKFFVIKNKFLKDFVTSAKKIELGDIIPLNIKDFLAFEKLRLENYYKNKLISLKKINKNNS